MNTRTLLRFLFLVSVLCFSHAAAVEPDSAEAVPIERILARNQGLRLAPCTKTPLAQLPDGNLLGNGDVGVVVSGTPATQIFYIGKNDFWAPNSNYGYLNPNQPRPNSGIGQQAYPIGGVTVEIPQLRSASFRQEMDLLRAETRSSFSHGDSQASMTSRVIAVDNLLVIDIENPGTAALETTVSTWTRAGNLGRLPEKTEVPDTSRAGVEGTIQWITRDSATKANDRWVTHASIATRILGTDSVPEVKDAWSVESTFSIPPGQRVQVVSHVGNAVRFADDFPLSRVKELVVTGDESLSATKAAVGKLSADAVRQLDESHRRWWSDFWAKSQVELPEEPLLERFFYGAVYLMGAGARPGRLPPGLFGPWITADKPSWSADYHLNYNHQHPWYGVYAINHPELAIPYCDSVINLLPLARETAAAMGEKGVAYRTGAGPYGWSHPSTHNMPNNAELAVNFRDYYDFTLDEDFLRDTAYPFFKEVAANWDGKLVKEPPLSGAAGDHRYSIKLAWDETGKPFANPTSALAFVRLLYRALADASQTLGLDPHERGHWQDVAAHLSTFSTTEYQGRTVLDFAEGANKPEGNPFPFNAYPFYPTACEGIDSPFRPALVNTLITRPSYWDQVNSFTQVYAAAAQGGYPADELVDRLRSRIAQTIEPSGFVLIPNHKTIDNAFAVNNITLLLLQSDHGFIHVFPNWNLRKEARFTTLRARGGVLVSSHASQGRVQYVALRSEKDSQVAIRNPWPGSVPKLLDGKGEAVAFTTAGQQLAFAARAGEEYRFVGQ
jgi:alpha-L-fucosidase 2